MPIIWNKNLSVSNDVIDHDHQFLISLINTIELVLRKKEDCKYLCEVLGQLKEYSIKHFRNEESIQRKIEYNQSIQQKRSHAKLLEDLEKLIAKINERGSLDEVFMMADEIIKFLRNWLVSHVIDEDLLMKPFLEKYPRAFS